MAESLKVGPLFLSTITLFASVANADAPVVGGALADGDVTQLNVYAMPAAERSTFEVAVRSAALAGADAGADMWLLYEDLSSDESTSRFFSVHFPHNVDELTEPDSASVFLQSVAGPFREHAELTRQVADWCSTTALDPDLQPYAFPEYLWLAPGTLHDAGKLLTERGEILRKVYGTNSEGNAAAEGFVAMVLPAQVMLVLFSSEPTREAATGKVLADMERHGVLDSWLDIEKRIGALVAKRVYRAGRYRSDLSFLD